MHDIPAPTISNINIKHTIISAILPDIHIAFMTLQARLAKQQTDLRAFQLEQCRRITLDLRRHLTAHALGITN